MPQQLLGSTDKALRWGNFWHRRHIPFRFQPLSENTLNRLVADLIETQSPVTGCFQPFIANLLAQPQQATHHRQPVHHRVRQQTPHQCCRGQANICCHFLANRTVQNQARQFVGWQMSRVGDALAWFGGAFMCRHQLVCAASSS